MTTVYLPARTSAVAEVLAQAADLTPVDLAALEAAWIANHSRYRLEQIRVASLVVKAADDADRVQEARVEAFRGLRHLGLSAAVAGSDAVLVALAGRLMTAEERGMFAGPWRSVIAGDGGYGETFSSTLFRRAA